MEKPTVAILAGGNSKRFGSEKALAEFRGHALVSHMVEIAHKISTEVMIVVSDDEQEDLLRKVVSDVRIVVDPPGETKCALVGAITAFEYTSTKHVLLLPVDAPLANTELLRLLLEICEGHGAVVPSWPTGYIEPLHSVYLAEHAYYHGLKVVESGHYKMRNLLERLKNVLYISTETLKQFDSDLSTFTNFNTQKELKDAERKSRKK
ncbi:MAG: molybdenum cofactor guanylyltransferase [Candidatus Thorarchaeota archaeon]